MKGKIGGKVEKGHLKSGKLQLEITGESRKSLSDAHRKGNAIRRLKKNHCLY